MATILKRFKVVCPLDNWRTEIVRPKTCVLNVVVIFGVPIINYFTFTNVVWSNFQLEFANAFAVAYLGGWDQGKCKSQG